MREELEFEGTGGSEESLKVLEAQGLSRQDVSAKADL